MDKLNEKITQHFEELITEGQEIIELTSNFSRYDYLEGTDIARVNSWVIRSGQLIKNICTEDSIYYSRIQTILKDDTFSQINDENIPQISILLGCVEGVYSDYKKGLINSIRNFLRAEIFNDFLEMGEYLLEEGYKDAAAVIIGSILEDALRKLAVQNKISIKKSSGQLKTMEPLNQELGKIKFYDKFIQKQVTSWADLRNNAAHGHYSKYDNDQVHMMLLFVQKFCSDYII